MVIWHLTSATPRFPFHVSAGQNVNLQLGTWPIEEGQRTWIDVRVVHPDGTEETGRVDGTWNFNREANSFWFINVGPFADGDRVEYRLWGSSPAGATDGGIFSFLVGPKIYLAILWHQHQPLYKDLQAKRPQGSYRFPWVRLHAIRDYYAMAALLEQHPEVHLTINLTPVLLQELEDYAERGQPRAYRNGAVGHPSHERGAHGHHLSGGETIHAHRTGQRSDDRGLWPGDVAAVPRERMSCQAAFSL